MSSVRLCARRMSRKNRNYLIKFIYILVFLFTLFNIFQWYKKNTQIDLNKKRILIITQARSGSTFLGDILQSYPNTYYDYQPIWYQYPSLKTHNTAKFLSDVLNCQGIDNEYVMNYIDGLRRRAFHGRNDDNKLLGSKCYGTYCYLPERMTKLCKNSTVHLMKEVEARMSILRPLINRFMGPGFRLIYYIRDPRGVYNSRKKLSQVEENLPIAEPKHICINMEEDWKSFLMYQKQYENNFHLLRYEDLALNPQNTARKLFQALNLTFAPQVKTFLETHTNLGSKWENINPAFANNDNKEYIKMFAYQTDKKSKIIPLQWAKFLTWDEIYEIQIQCGRVMKDLGYKIIRNQEELINITDPSKFYM